MLLQSAWLYPTLIGAIWAGGVVQLMESIFKVIIKISVGSN
jgi:hypothetical protein